MGRATMLARAHLRPLVATLAVAGVALLAAPVGNAAAMTCDGKKVTIMGTPGPDTIVGKHGNDVIYGGGGNDRISGGANGNDTICGGPGDDTLVGGRGNDILLGEAGNDRLLGGRGADSLYGGEGEDFLEGGRGTEKAIDGGPGNDRLFGGRGNDPMEGGEGSDYLDGGLGDDNLEGGPGDGDVVVGNLGSDTLNGGEGNGDVVRGDLGHDKIDGGPGSEDIASFSSATEGVSVDLEAGTATGDGQDTLAGIEDVVGSPFADHVYGDSGPNRLDGGGGYDQLEGRGGADQLYGGPGGAQCGKGAATEQECERPPPLAPGPVVVRSHSIDGSGSLSVQGTPGADGITVSFEGGNFVVADTGNPVPAGNAQGCDAAGGAAVCAADVQTISVDAGAGDDEVRIAESVPADVQVRIQGGAGADQLYGGPGNDILEAGDDNEPDLLSGGPGDDGLVGARTDLPTPFDSGKSTLIGGPGSDLLVGGDPCDGDSFDGGPGQDTASFMRFNPGVTAEIGGPVTRAGANCTPGHIDVSIEALEGSEGPDTLIAPSRANGLIGHGGNNTLIYRSGRSPRRSRR